MNQLFIELYLDEDVDVLILDLLRARGFAAITTKTAGNLGATDEEQFTYAAANQKTLLTHNRDDFELLVREYFAAGRSHYGAIIAVRRPPHAILSRLLPILNQVTADEMQDQVRYI